MRIQFNLILFTLVLMIGVTSESISQCPPSGSGIITLTTQTQVDAFCSSTFPGCTMLPTGVDLNIQDDNDGVDNITNLNGLSCINSIEGNFKLIQNNFLTDLTGLVNLSAIGGTFESFDNDILASLSGLNEITSIGNLRILQNDILTNLEGLNNLSSLSGSLLIGANDNLENLSGLDNLVSIGSFAQITSNDNLTDLGGLDNVLSIKEALIIRGNTNLSDCCVLCALLAEDQEDDSVIGGAINIFDNNLGCQSDSDVRSCSPCQREAAEDIPTLGEWGLLTLSLIFMILSTLAIKKRVSLLEV